MGDHSDSRGFVWRLDDGEQRRAYLDYWGRCERVAMHFNDLIIRFRTQALGGLAVIGSVLGLARGVDRVDWRMLGFALFALLAFWLSVFLVDQIYYSKLLQGAVDELKRVEELAGGAVQLSTRIEERCSNGRAAATGRWIFYMLPSLALVVLASLCLAQNRGG